MCHVVFMRRGRDKSIDLHRNRAFGPFLMCARPPLISSLLQAHKWVLVYKPNKGSCLFSMWDKILLKNHSLLTIPHIFQNMFEFKTFFFEYGRRCKCLKFGVQ